MSRAVGSGAGFPTFVAVIGVGVVLALVGVVVIPVLLLERADDWRAYAEAATALKSGAPLYPWTVSPDIRALGHPYLYPPPLAAIWSLGMTPELFAVIKAACLAGSIWMLVRAIGGSAAIAAVVAVVAVTSTPMIHDLMLGNVMALIATGAALTLTGSKWIGPSALGAVCAIALKPAIGPYLVWLFIRRRGTFVQAFVAGLAATAVFVVILGPGRYIEYLEALPKTAALAAPFTGNLGLAAISPVAVVIGLGLAYLWTIAAAIRLDDRAAGVVALSMTQLAQPTIGLNYAVLLIPGVILLWTVDRRAAVVMAMALPLVVILSPLAAAVLLAATATAAGVVAKRQVATVAVAAGTGS